MKEKPVESVVHDWVSTLPFTQQAVLFCAMRGADGLPKNNNSKFITQFLRGVVLKPAYPNFKTEDDYQPDGFMRCDFRNFFRDMKNFFDDVDTFPHHYFMHLIHACQIVGYNYPQDILIDGAWVSGCFTAFYNKACKSFHMVPETFEAMNKRLSK